MYDKNRFQGLSEWSRLESTTGQPNDPDDNLVESYCQLTQDSSTRLLQAVEEGLVVLIPTGQSLQVEDVLISKVSSIDRRAITPSISTPELLPQGANASHSFDLKETGRKGSTFTVIGSEVPLVQLGAALGVVARSPSGRRSHSERSLQTYCVTAQSHTVTEWSFSHILPQFSRNPDLRPSI